jgi:hypothetical protein
MKNLRIVFILFSIFFAFYIGISSANDDKKAESVQIPSAQASQPNKQLSQPQPVKPALLPAAPSNSGISPADPLRALADTIATEINKTVGQSGHGSLKLTESAPGTSVYSVTLPGAAHNSVPLMGRTTGKVLKKGLNNDNTAWIEVEDKMSGKTVEIEVKNLKGAPILKEGKMISFNDIKVGDSVNTLYTVAYTKETSSSAGVISSKESKSNEAVFVQILTK